MPLQESNPRSIKCPLCESRIDLWNESGIAMLWHMIGHGVVRRPGTVPNTYACVCGLSGGETYMAQHMVELTRPYDRVREHCAMAVMCEAAGIRRFDQEQAIGNILKDELREARKDGRVLEAILTLWQQEIPGIAAAVMELGEISYRNGIVYVRLPSAGEVFTLDRELRCGLDNKTRAAVKAHISRFKVTL